MVLVRVGVVCSVVSGLVWGVVPVAVAGSAVECVGGVSSEVDAVRVAVECGGDVEVLGARSEWDTVFAQPDGSMRVDVSSRAVRARVGGGWAEIDTSVVAGPDGLVVASPVHEMVFSDGSPGQPLVRMERDGHVVTMDSPVELTPPVVDGSSVVYPGVLPGVDLVVSVNEDGTGFSEVLRVESLEAARNPRLERLDFPVEVSDGVNIAPDEDGGFTVEDAQGRDMFTSPQPVMWDSSGDKVSAMQAARVGAVVSEAARVVEPQFGDEVAVMDTVIDSDAVVVAPDEGVLQSSDTVWPVFIDPGISGNRHEWTQLQSGYPDSASRFNFSTPGDSSMGIGVCNPSESAECSKWSAMRLVYEFNGLDFVGNLDGSHIVRATFAVYGKHSWSCTPTGVDVHVTGDMGPGSTWNNHAGSWGALQASAAVAHKASCNNRRNIEFDVTHGARMAADSNSNQLTLGMKASNESTSMASSWKGYGAEATLSIEYNRAPYVSSASMSGPSAACAMGVSRPVIRSTTPTLRAHGLTDPDGGIVYGHFGIHQNGASTYYHAAPGVNSGNDAAFTVPSGVLEHNRVYLWQAQASDPLGWAGPVISCEFEVDVMAPSAPTVGATVYRQDQIVGGVGVSDTFTFMSKVDTDVVQFKYSFDSDALNKNVGVVPERGTASNPLPDWSTGVSYTPTTAGSHTLYYQAVDRAGWVSPVKILRFNVAFPGRVGLWSLNEGTGSTAADSSASGAPLTLTGGPTWGPGMLNDLVGDPTDHGLVLNTSGQYAATASPVVAVNESFSVMAMVKPSTLNGSVQTAVSQDGNSGAGFTLGLHQDAQCSQSSGCWTFSMAGQDSPTPTTRGLTISDRPVITDEWVHLTATYNAATKETQLYVCDPLNLDDPPTQPHTGSFTPTWNAANSLRIGNEKSNTTTTNQFIGGIDDIRAYRGVVDYSTVYQVCHGEG